MMVVLPSRHYTALIQHRIFTINSIVAAFSTTKLLEWALLETFYKAMFSLSTIAT